MSMLDLQQYTQDLAAIRKTLKEAGDALHIESLKETLEELTEEMNQPEFWNDTDRANKINQKVGNIRNKLEHYEGLISTADDIEVAMEMAEEEQDESMVDEAGTMLADLKEKTAALELETLMRGQYDDHNAVLSLHAGAGGTEAQDWTGMLYRMFTRYCEQMGFTVKVLDYLDGDEAGVKSVTFEVSGAGEFKVACNGDATSLESFTQPRMRLFSGKLVLIVQSLKQAGEVTVRVRSAARNIEKTVTLRVG